MSNDAPSIVNDWYWLKRAAEIVSDSAKKLDDGARAIAAAMAWFWTVYSGAIVAATALSKRELTLTWAFLLAAPALMLFVAYSVATWASLPIPIAFNVIAPEEIKLAHEAWIAKKRRHLSFSLALGGVAAALVAAAVVMFALAEPGRTDRIGFQAADGTSGPEIIVGGRTADARKLLVQITAPGYPTVTRLVVTAKDEDFTIAIPVPLAPSYDAQLSWTAENRTTAIHEQVKRP
jgi:hypothetical protein